MGRLKKDHGGWKTSGIWLKYQTPSVNETPARPKSKKDTVRWCRGKTGVSHEWHSFQRKRFNDDTWEYTWQYTEVKCVICKKKKYIKTSKSTRYPTHLFITTSEQYDTIPVRINKDPKE